MSETTLRLKFFGDQVLRKKAKPISKITPWHRDTLSQMAQLMYAESGVGLAAPQVGLGEAMIVADIGSGLYKLINPKVIRKDGSQAREEGCLSLPGICIKVKRAKKVIVEAQDDQARPVRIEAEDLLACVLQHEIDHLKGKLIVDYASFWGKTKIEKQLEAVKKKAKGERLSEQRAQSCQLQL